jgi:hypothetical protein
VLDVGAVDLDGLVVVVQDGCVHVGVPLLGFISRHAIWWLGRAEAVEPETELENDKSNDIRPALQTTYLCTSPAASPRDCHNSTMTVNSPNVSKTLGFRAVFTMCRGGGSRAFALFHE